MCLLPKVTGPCHAYIHRFYYDVHRKKCRRFGYGGCKGNGNNFGTKAECLKTCTTSKSNYGVTLACKFLWQTLTCK